MIKREDQENPTHVVQYRWLEVKAFSTFFFGSVVEEDEAGGLLYNKEKEVKDRERFFLCG